MHTKFSKSMNKQTRQQVQDNLSEKNIIDRLMKIQMNKINISRDPLKKKLEFHDIWTTQKILHSFFPLSLFPSLLFWLIFPKPRLSDSPKIFLSQNGRAWNPVQLPLLAGLHTLWPPLDVAESFVREEGGRGILLVRIFFYWYIDGTDR